MSLEAVNEELQAHAWEALKGYTDAVAAVRDFKLERAYDAGFEAGVVATENGLGRADADQ